MQGFREHIDETTQMRLVDLLPKKIKRKIYRIAHADKYKGALAMYHSFKKNADMKKRGVSDQKMRDIAADHFKLNHREFAKVLNRKTRYEAVKDWSITEAYNLEYENKSDIKSLPYSSKQKDDIDKLFKKLGPGSLVFNPKGGKIKVNTTLNKKYKLDDLHKEFPSLHTARGAELLIWGTGSVSNKKSVMLSDFGIATNTDFLEFFQAIGLFIPSPLTPNTFKKQLTDLKIVGDFQIRSYIKEWQKFVDYLDADKTLGSDVISLVNGSHYYKNKIDVKRPYVIWTGIKTYYTNLKNKEGIEGTIKDNTSDCVLVDGTETELYKALKSDSPIIMDEKTGKLSCNGIEWYQISLKLGMGKAKLGKITFLLKGKYPVDGDTQDNMARAGIDTSWFGEELEYQQLLREGFFGSAAAKMKQIGGAALKKFKVAAVAVLKYWNRIKGFISKLAKRYEKSTFTEIERMTKRSKFLGEGYIAEDVLNEMSQGAMLNAIVKDSTITRKYANVIKKHYNTVAKNKNTDVCDVRIENQKFDITEPGAINFLVANVISFQIINDIISDVNKNGIKVINDLNQAMSMGDTNLPVVKVYGNPSAADYEVITVGKITQKNPELDGKQIKVLKAAVLPHKINPYWVINMWIFAELDNGIAKYHKIAFKKSGASAFNFNIEGTSTVPEDKITEFPV